MASNHSIFLCLFLLCLATSWGYGESQAPKSYQAAPPVSGSPPSMAPRKAPVTPPPPPPPPVSVSPPKAPVSPPPPPPPPPATVSPPKAPVSPPKAPVTPPVTPPPSLPYYGPGPPVNKQECVPLCEKRCSLHSRKRLCVRACSTCCLRCKCVPPGTYGNKQLCGRCYTDMTTHGGRPKCP